MTTKIIDIQEPWFSFIRNGLKKVEGKKGSPKWVNLKVGDKIKFINKNSSFIAKIIRINRYCTLDDYLTNETLSKVLPGIKTIEEGKGIYTSSPISWTQEEIHNYGIMALELSLE